MTLRKKAFENILGKGDYAGKQHFLLLKNFSSFDGSQCCTSLPNNNILDLTKLKACTDDKINATQKVKFVME